jgi:hypothetical protein
MRRTIVTGIEKNGLRSVVEEGTLAWAKLCESD